MASPWSGHGRARECRARSTTLSYKADGFIPKECQGLCLDTTPEQTDAADCGSAFRVRVHPRGGKLSMNMQLSRRDLFKGVGAGLAVSSLGALGFGALEQAAAATV